MASFSERYGYTKPSEIIIREQITEPIQNSILNWLEWFIRFDYHTYYSCEKAFWRYYFNQKIIDYKDTSYGRGATQLFISYFSGRENAWYSKLDLLEQILGYLKNDYQWTYDETIEHLNSEFERHNFAYRIIDGKVEEITSKEEIQSIEEAIKTSDNGVKTHLKAALEFLYASNKTPDYRNSIKESISAVEALCRNLTGENTLGKAINKLETQGITIQPMLKKGIENLYFYTNDKDTGIRHALIDDSYTPSSDEAIFMLVTCSAFINFLKKKNGN